MGIMHFLRMQVDMTPIRKEEDLGKYAEQRGLDRKK
jgi:hypothetical protein